MKTKETNGAHYFQGSIESKIMNLINPFENLYITEQISEKEYVDVISTHLVKHASSLFVPGNVAVLGTQGSGKTTLLTLLKPEIREAYFFSKEKFPVDFSNFISPGINFLKSGILDIGRRPIHKSQDEEENIFPLFFGDFFNYYICIDIFLTLEKIKKHKSNTLMVDMDDKKLDAFVNSIKKEDCWFGYLDEINTFDQFNKSLVDRKAIYRKYHQFNLPILPSFIEETKTNIGEPISRIARALKEFEIISENTNIFIRVDQIETLLSSDDIRPGLGCKYRRLLNSALSTRDPNISYKIGSRTYAWKKELRIYNSDSMIEENRSYTLIDVDKLLRRKENRKSYFFPAFARDIFYRRLHHYRMIGDEQEKIFDKLFKGRLTSEDKAKQYCKNKDSVDALKLPKDFPQKLKDFLVKLCKENPLNAILATAWYQQGDNDRPKTFNINDFLNNPPPWEDTAKNWWRKERIKLALMQLASNCNQSLVWGGVDDLLALGSAGTLSFLNICRHIWDTYLRTIDTEKNNDEAIINSLLKNGISIDIQNLGIISASAQWFAKIAELPNGEKWLRFAENMGIFFRNRLLDDKKMSHPGHTGFSLSISDLRKNEDIRIFLQDVTDYGILFEVSHTTKEKNKQPRKKWYFSPIFCPYIKIYEERIKEPFYTKTTFVKELLEKPSITNKTTDYNKKKNNISQLIQPSLFEDIEI
jgi:hypothetical protein